MREVVVGDRIGVWDGTHQASARVVKINRKTIIAIEEPKSHAPGRRWRIDKTYPFSLYEADGLVLLNVQ